MTARVYVNLPEGMPILVRKMTFLTSGPWAKRVRFFQTKPGGNPGRVGLARQMLVRFADPILLYHTVIPFWKGWNQETISWISCFHSIGLAILSLLCGSVISISIHNLGCLILDSCLLWKIHGNYPKTSKIPWFFLWTIKDWPRFQERDVQRTKPCAVPFTWQSMTVLWWLMVVVGRHQIQSSDGDKNPNGTGVQWFLYGSYQIL